jgi:hypothetical protein
MGRIHAGQRLSLAGGQNECPGKQSTWNDSMKAMKHPTMALAVVALAGALLAGAGCSKSDSQSNQSSGNTQTNVLYTCSMHPDVVTNAPGKCPRCGMDLVKK